MGTDFSKSTIGGGVAAIGIAGIGLSLYFQYLVDCKKYEESKKESYNKEQYLFETFSEKIKVYLEECKEELKSIHEDNLCLSIHFFWNFYSILDIMMENS